MREKGKVCRDCTDCPESAFFMPDLPPDVRANLSEKIRCRRMKRGSTLFREGDRVDAIYMIRRGRVKLTRWDAEGHEQIVGFFSEPETIWEGMLIEGSVFPYSAQCLTDAQICVLHSADFMEVLKEPVVSLSMLSMLSRKLHDANERNLVLSTKDPKARLAAFLLYREKRDRETAIQVKLEDIAASLNLRPETVSRKLNELIDEGLIKRVGKSGIQILDFEALEEMRG